jgi:hypothetical protein
MIAMGEFQVVSCIMKGLKSNVAQYFPIAPKGARPPS